MFKGDRITDILPVLEGFVLEAIAEVAYVWNRCMLHLFTPKMGAGRIAIIRVPVRQMY